MSWLKLRDWGLTHGNVAECVNDNPLTALNLDDLGCTVWHATVIDETCDTSLLRRVYHSAVVDSEQVTTADAAFKIALLSDFRNLLSNLLANILNNHVVLGDVLHGV